MVRVISIILLLSFVGLSCTDSNRYNTREMNQLRLENDSLKAILIKNRGDVKLEINMIVTDAKAAADYYRKVLNAEIISQTDNVAGMNETMMILGGVEIRVLDENREFGMIAPSEAGGGSIGINLFVYDIDEFFSNAIKEGCNIISPVQDFPDIPAKNAVFSDKFNHLWIVNQQY